jgi:lipoate-protein ligase A
MDNAGCPEKVARRSGTFGHSGDCRPGGLRGIIPAMKRGGGAVAHGEYKMPGGKLVVVDFEIEDGRLRGVVVSGDFFLYPDEVLDAMTAALESLPVSLSEAGIAEQVTAAIPAGASLMGVTPEGIAIAVRRALQEAGQA